MLAVLYLLASADGATPSAEVLAPVSDGLRILVVAPRAAAGRVEEIYSGLRAAGLQPVELDERAGVDREGAPPPRLGGREEARAHLQEAKARFRDLDLEGTRAAYDAAVEEVLRLQRPEESMETLVDALILRANAALQSGVEQDAHEALVLMARLEPERRELHPGLHPPSLVEAFAAARADEEARPSSALVVRPRVAGFATPEVLVDGRVVTATTSLRLGPHLVTVRAPDTVPFSRILEVGAEPLVLEPFLAPADAAGRRERLVERARSDVLARGTALAEVAELSAARAVLYLDDVSALLFVTGRPFEALRAAPTADGALLGKATLAVLQAPARKDTGAPDEESIGLAAIVTFTAIGVIALAGTVSLGVVVLTPPKEFPAPPRPISITCCVR